MALEWMDGFDHYGTSGGTLAGQAAMLAGVYAELATISSGSNVPPHIDAASPRTGTYALRDSVVTSSPTTIWRRVLGARPKWRSSTPFPMRRRRG